MTKHKKMLKKVFNCYKDFMTEQGYPPSYEQLHNLTNISKGYISELVKELVILGYLEKPRGKVIIITGKDFK